jgi:hypothetical protein
MMVKTSTNYDFLPMPTRLCKFPENVIFCFFSSYTYASPPVLMSNNTPTNIPLTDALISIMAIADDHIDIEITLNDSTEDVTCKLDGSCKSNKPAIVLKDGRDEITLSDYLSNYPLIFKTTDDTVIEGNEICTGSPESIFFSSENIVAIDWEQRSADIHQECGEIFAGKKPIQITTSIT